MENIGEERMSFARAVRRTGFVSLSLGLLAAGAMLHAACERGSRSQAAPGSRNVADSQVLAKIDDVVITVGDFQGRINQQSPYVRARYTSLERKKEFLDNLIRFEVLAKEAERRGLQNDEEVVRTMKQVMIQKLMKDQFDSSVKVDDISDAEVKAYYDTHPDEFNKPEEVRVADILVKDERTAKKVLADPRIKGVDNAGFRTLVAEFSQDPTTKDRGGDLRYFDANTKELPPEIVKAAFQLANIGDVSEPVRTAQGLHLLKLTGRRKALVRALDEVKPQIKNRLYRDKRQQGMEDYVKKLRDKAHVEVHEDRLAKVAIDTSGGGSPNLTPPGPGMFHPGAPGAPQATPMMPGMPPGSQKITLPPSTNAPQPPLPPSTPGNNAPQPSPAP
jgi:peptidyl-prolyl cis-trans isomerase C